MRGSRVQAIVQELRGEKIDIVPWSPDPAKYVYNALAPAECTQVTVDEANESLEVIVPDDQLSLAIGRQGQNVRLAAKLMGWKIDVKSETRYRNSQDPNYQAMLRCLGMTESIADHLFKKGIRSIGDLAKADPEELRKDAIPFVEEARKFLEENGPDYACIPVPEQGPGDEDETEEQNLQALDGQANNDEGQGHSPGASEGVEPDEDGEEGQDSVEVNG